MKPDVNRPELSEERPLQAAPTGELIGQLFKQGSGLLKKELELARAEIESTVKSAVTVTAGMLMAGVIAVVALAACAASAVLALAQQMEPWAAALIVGVALFAIAGVTAMVMRSKTGKKPLERTQKTLKEDVQWAKEKVA